MKKRLRSPAVLVVVFAMVIATAGVVYAHWSTWTHVQGNVNTGDMAMGWGEVGTNDDGVTENDPTGTDGDTGTDYNGNHTANDPKDGDNPSARYTKDVAECNAWSDGGEWINLDIHNAYPSYVCHLFAEAYNYGSVPVKAAAISLTAEKGYHECTQHLNETDAETGINALPIAHGEHGEFVDFGNDGVFDAGTDGWLRGDHMGSFADLNNDDTFNGGDVRLYDYCEWVGFGMTINPTAHPGEYLLNDELTFHIEQGILCGDQIDPGVAVDTMGWIHVEQPAEQNSQYQFTLTQEWVNWNEWDPSMCTLLP